MYESFFEMTDCPFPAVPRAAQHVPTTEMENARSVIGRCISRGEGPVCLVGPAGTGKTHLCLVLAEQLRSSFRVVRLEGGRLSTRRALLQAILHGLGLPYRGIAEGELRLNLVDHLSNVSEHPRPLAVIVDEAHTVPLRLLEELRLLSNLARAGEARLRLVLAGTPLLEERLASGKMELLSQRLAARCYLGPLTRAETRDYIHGRIVTVGGSPEKCFTDAAVQAVHDATEGIPRLINQVCDHALLLAYANNGGAVEASGIHEAWADLQQLPTPEKYRQHAGATGGTRSLGVVEFGSLGAGATSENREMTRPTVYAPEEAPDTVPDSPEGDYPDTDEEFVPAATIGPRLEVVLEGFHDPFGEPFEREDIVIDRCARLQSEFARDLGPWHASESLLMPPDGVVRLRGESAAPANPNTWHNSAGQSPEVSPIDDATSEGNCRALPDREEDLIIVLDESPSLDDDRPMHVVPAVRRFEFADLFARLRHG